MRIPLRQIICLIFGLTSSLPAYAMQACPEGTGQNPYLVCAPAVFLIVLWLIWLRRQLNTSKKRWSQVLTSLLSFALAVLACVASMAVALAFVPCS